VPITWSKTFSSAIAGLLTIPLSSCSGLRAPSTLFLTFSVGREQFKIDETNVRNFLDENSKAFQRSNPETRVVYITYTSSDFVKQISGDSDLNLGPDLILTDIFVSDALYKRNLTATLPDKKYFKAIYGPQFQWAALENENSEYTFAPWLINTQIACFNNTKIKKSPRTIQELEDLSASGRKIGLSSEPFELIWSAGTKGAITEISSVGDQRSSNQTFPAIRGWLEWIRKAALYQNIYFFDNSRDLSEEFKNKKLDWIPCWSSQMKDLKSKMGNTLSVSALPNGLKSKASPPINIYGFALGKNSSQSQREMALKFIKSSVNTISQRKLQFGDSGLLAANQNVSIPPKSSSKLKTLNYSFKEQFSPYFNEWPGLIRWLSPESRSKPLSRTFTEFTNGYLSVNETMKIVTSLKTN